MQGQECDRSLYIYLSFSIRLQVFRALYGEEPAEEAVRRGATRSDRMRLRHLSRRVDAYCSRNPVRSITILTLRHENNTFVNLRTAEGTSSDIYVIIVIINHHNASYTHARTCARARAIRVGDYRSYKFVEKSTTRLDV